MIFQSPLLFFQTISPLKWFIIHFFVVTCLLFSSILSDLVGTWTLVILTNASLFSQTTVEKCQTLELQNHNKNRREVAKNDNAAGSRFTTNQVLYRQRRIIEGAALRSKWWTKYRHLPIRKYLYVHEVTLAHFDFLIITSKLPILRDCWPGWLN